MWTSENRPKYKRDKLRLICFPTGTVLSRDTGTLSTSIDRGFARSGVARWPLNPTPCPALRDAPDRLLNPFGRGPPKQRSWSAARCNQTGSRSKETGFSTSLRTDSSEGW